MKGRQNWLTSTHILNTSVRSFGVCLKKNETVTVFCLFSIILLCICSVCKNYSRRFIIFWQTLHQQRGTAADQQGLHCIHYKRDFQMLHNKRKLMWPPSCRCARKRVRVTHTQSPAQGSCLFVATPPAEKGHKTIKKKVPEVTCLGLFVIKLAKRRGKNPK